MRFIPDDEATLWLREFIPDPENFDWDSGNINKNQKHGFNASDIESVFLQYQYVFTGKIVEPEHAEWRGIILGRTASGKLVALIFTRRGEKLRPISCRSMRKNEREFYEKTEK